MRAHTECSFGHQGHSLRKCPSFYQCKQKFASNTYFTKSLHLDDENGFCAAGVCVYAQDLGGEYYILMLKEKRGGVDGLNFPGGGRESVYSLTPNKLGLIPDIVLSPETPNQTASSEFEEELSDLLGSDHNIISEVSYKLHIHKDIKMVVGSQKYILFPIKVDFHYVTSLELQAVIPKNSEAQDVVWVPLSKCHEYPIHKFAGECVNLLYLYAKLLFN
jgi:hypothetical protein